MPFTTVNGLAPSGVGSYRTPVLVRYGCSVTTTFGSGDVVVTWTMSRCFWVRYSTEVTVIRSGTGLSVTVAVAAAEVVPPAFVAVTEMVITGLPTVTVGAMNDTVAEVAVTGVTVRLSRA